MDKKGVEMTISTIVIVALALLVLIVIAIIFTQNIGKGQSQLNVVTNPLVYRAACLAAHQDDPSGYETCVKQCEGWAKNPKTATKDSEAQCTITPPPPPPKKP
jgi:hypothetical protein